MMVDYEAEEWAEIYRAYSKGTLSADDKWSRVEFDEDEIKSSPSDLYLHSLRIKQRLPQELHDAMMLWSFHPDGKEYARMYLEWVERCDLWEESRVRFERDRKNFDRFHSISMVVCGVAFLIFLLMGFYGKPI
jgi:hypothetical protein